MTIEQTSLRVPTTLRDRIKAGAEQHGETQADYIARALRELEHRELIAAIAGEAPYDDEELAELYEWDQADLTPGAAE